MRKIGYLVGCGALLVMALALADGIQAQQKKGTGGAGAGGFGGGGGGPAAAALTLLNRAEVKKELELTDEQLEKLPAEVLAAIAKVLNEKQNKRFKQIELQQRGNRAFADKTVQTALKINDEQQKNIGSILEEATKERAEAIKGAFGKGGAGGKGAAGGFGEKTAKIDAEAKDKILQVLSKEQRKSWREMVGEELKLPPTGFGGVGGFLNKGKDAKKDPPTDK